jgi:hypothetical protein
LRVDIADPKNDPAKRATAAGSNVEKAVKPYTDCPAVSKHNPRAARRRLTQRLKGVAQARQPNLTFCDEAFEDPRRAEPKPLLKKRARLDPDGEAR